MTTDEYWHTIAESYREKPQEPFEDAISRQAAIDAFSMFAEYESNRTNAEWVNRTRIVLSSLPSVTPKQRTGHWIETAEEYYKAVNEYGGGVNEDTPYFVDDIACSECLSMFSVIDNETERFDCCPHCGAKMVEPQESEDKCVICANNGMIDDECAYCTNHNLFKAESEEQDADSD